MSVHSIPYNPPKTESLDASVLLFLADLSMAHITRVMCGSVCESITRTVPEGILWGWACRIILGLMGWTPKL